MGINLQVRVRAWIHTCKGDIEEHHRVRGVGRYGFSHDDLVYYVGGLQLRYRFGRETKVYFGILL